MYKQTFNAARRLKLKLHSIQLRKFEIRIKQFVRDYNLPLLMTGIFLLLVMAAAFLRMSQQSSLADLLVSVTNTGKDYGTLFSKDKTGELKLNNDEDRPAPAGGDAATFTINTNTGSGSSAAGNPAGGAPQPVVFTSAIAYFRQDSAKLECKTPKPKPQTCSKKYVFKAGIRAQNGPGTVKYSWRSSLEAAIESGSVPVGGGNITFPLQKIITLDCNRSSNFSLQFVIQSPSLSRSAPINVNHNCNEI